MDQTYDLFDSLIREIFIGTIIYGKPGFGMTLRQIDDRPRKGKGRGPRSGCATTTRTRSSTRAAPRTCASSSTASSASPPSTAP